MGGAVSAGEDNEELVDNLVEGDFVRQPSTEAVLRAVDRGWFVQTDSEDGDPRQAYKDTAWKEGHLHISAPCIYSQALDSLEPREGMHILNVGSGTGYFSTLLSLLVAPSGTSHGIELHKDAIDYANERQDFLESLGHRSPFLHFPYSRPEFRHGNILAAARPWLPSYGPYDRLYVGAGVAEEATAEAEDGGGEGRESILAFLLSFLKLGGVAVVPLGDQLMKYRVVGPGEWEATSLMNVSFASLVLLGSSCQRGSLTLPPLRPPGLQNACRQLIHGRIREGLAGRGLQNGLKRRVSNREERETGRDGGDSEEGGSGSASATGLDSQRRRDYKRRRACRRIAPFMEIALRQQRGDFDVNAVVHHIIQGRFGPSSRPNNLNGVSSESEDERGRGRGDRKGAQGDEEEEDEESAGEGDEDGEREGEGEERNSEEAAEAAALEEERRERDRAREEKEASQVAYHEAFSEAVKALPLAPTLQRFLLIPPHRSHSD